MAKTMILPAALRYQQQVAASIAALKAVSEKIPAGQTELLSTLVSTIDAFQAATAKLEKALSHHADGDLLSHTKHARDHILASMAEVRKHGDALETLVADDLWPLPTYREMLFFK